IPVMGPDASKSYLVGHLADERAIMVAAFPMHPASNEAPRFEVGLNSLLHPGKHLDIVGLSHAGRAEERLVAAQTRRVEFGGDALSVVGYSATSVWSTASGRGTRICTPIRIRLGKIRVCVPPALRI